MRRKGGLILFCSIVIVFTSCTTPGRGSRGLHRVEKVKKVSSKGYPSPVQVSGRIDFSAPEYRHLWNTVPREGRFIVFAQTPRREFRDEEITYCIKDAARQVSLFYAARVETRQAVASAGGGFGYLESVKTGFDKTLAEQAVPHIKIIEYFQDAEGSCILAEDPDIPVSLDYEWSTMENGRPRWITSIPTIPGYLVSVGVVQRSRYLADSLRKADDQALANLSRQISINVKSKRTDLEVEGGTAHSQTHYEVSSSLLKGFYVLGRWSGDHGNTFYTLAVCKQGAEE